MVFADGHEIAQSCYGNEPITLDAVGHGEPVALFVQNTEAGQGFVSLTDFIVEQTAAPTCTPPAHDRCDTGPAMSQPSCDPCVESICGADPYCCSTYWDSICVGEVTSVCNETCSDCAHDLCQTGPALESGCDGPAGLRQRHLQCGPVLLQQLLGLDLRRRGRLDLQRPMLAVRLNPAAQRGCPHRLR